MRFLVFPTLFLFFFQHIAQAQDQMFQRYDAVVFHNGVELKYPFAGGLNNAQLSPADLNNDGIADLVIFDRSGDVVLTFLNQGIAGQTSYTYAPEYACHFPELTDYALMRDYNKDGAADIFCSSLAGGSQEVQVFRGYFENNALKFEPVLFFYPNSPSGQVHDPRYIWYPANQPGFWNNLTISKEDLPDFVDTDGDGDLDILTFAASVGGHTWLLKNFAVEMGYSLDSLKYRLIDDCWGRFYESGFEPCINDLSSTPNCCAPCFAPGDPLAEDRQERHPGSTVMAYDQDGDGDMELVLGDISFDCLNMMTNGGSPDQAWMTSQDMAFPSYNVPLSLSIFPAAFYLDLNNDGKKDLAVAPNFKPVGEDQKCLWYYRNTATSGHHFELETKSLFVSDMIDLGTAAHPVFVDVDGNGLTDLVAGNNGHFIPGMPGNSNNSSLYLYLNVGSPTEPRFSLADKNWLNMAQYAPNDFDFSPTFGDIDSDGDLDLLVGSYVGGLYCYRNIAGADNPMIFEQDFDPMWATMDVASSSTPAIFDLDGDDLQDVIYGEYQGNINFFKNIGTPIDPKFANQPVVSKIGGIDTEIISGGEGYSAPVFVQTPDGPILVTGGVNGQLRAYSNPAASADPFPIISLKWGGTDDGNRSCPAFADLDGDGTLEMAVGNLRGGLSLYKTTLVDCSTSAVAPEPTTLALTIRPNPAHAWAQVQWPNGAPARWRIFNALGQLKAEGEASGSPLNISSIGWEEGVYFLEIITNGQRGAAKLAVRH